MATNNQTPAGINIKVLPRLNAAQSGDYLILETPDGTGLIDYKDMVISIDQVDFKPTVVDLVTSVISLSSEFAALSGDVYADLEQKIVGNVAVFKNVSPLTAVQAIDGLAVKLPFNYIEVNNISTQQVADDNVFIACGDTTLSRSASAFVFDKGTYKTRIDAHVTALCSTPTWIQLYLYQETAPLQVLQHGSAWTATAQNQQGHLFIDGYFYLCRTSQVTLKADTYGSFNLGQPTWTLMNTASGNIALSATLLRTIQASACNISMFIEKVSDNDIPHLNKLGVIL